MFLLCPPFEPLLQIDFLTELFKKAKENGIKVTEVIGDMAYVSDDNLEKGNPYFAYGYPAEYLMLPVVIWLGVDI